MLHFYDFVMRLFVQQDPGEVYYQLFGAAVERYNAHQKRNDRRIPDYFQHLFNREPSASVIKGANKQKSFYKDLVQIGTKDDTLVKTGSRLHMATRQQLSSFGSLQRNMQSSIFAVPPMSE